MIHSKKKYINICEKILLLISIMIIILAFSNYYVRYIDNKKYEKLKIEYYDLEYKVENNHKDSGFNFYASNKSDDGISVSKDKIYLYDKDNKLNVVCKYDNISWECMEPAE